MKQVNEDHEHCAQQYQQKIGEVHAKVNVLDRRPANETPAETDIDLRTVCW
jgi:hypothetical protein